MKELDKLWDVCDDITPENLEEFRAALDKEEILNIEEKARSLSDYFIILQDPYKDRILIEKMLIYGQLAARMRKV